MAETEVHAHHHLHHGPAPHVPPAFGRAFAIGTALNIGFVIVEAVCGFLANSMALLADAGHNLSDVLGLVVGWVAFVLSSRPPSGRFTYGLRGSSIVAAMFNAVLLLLAVGAIVWEALLRLADPQPVAGTTMILVAAIGIAINGATAWLFASGSKVDLNIRGACLHMAADAAVSLGVVCAGIAIGLTGWLLIDPIVGLLIVAVIVWGTLGLLRDSLAMSLAAVPQDIDPVAVRRYLAGLPGVTKLHDLHIWPMSTTETALTVHLVMPEGHPGDESLKTLAGDLKRLHRIGHAIVQIETGEDFSCALESDLVV